MKNLSQALSEITMGLKQLWPNLREKLDQHCRQKNIQIRIYILRLIFTLAGIDESDFAVLYHGKVNRLPTSPKLLFKMLVAKEILNLSDNRLIEEMKSNFELRFLLGVVREKDVPCRTTLYRFRQKLRRHYRKTGEDLAEKIINSLIRETQSQILGLGKHVVFRIDSTLVDAFLRESNRMGLFYTTLRAFVKSLAKKELDYPEELEHYTFEGEYNIWFYRKRNDEFTQAYWKILLEDMNLILSLDRKHFNESPYYPILKRLAEEQTFLDGDGKRRLKDKNDIPANSLQSPFDPDATYRFKNGAHVGYVVNFVEMVVLNDKDEIIARSMVHYQLEQNTYSDMQFLRDFLNEFPAPEETCELVCDGAYFSDENSRLAREKNFILCPTDLVGKKPDPIMKDFTLSEDGKELITCPNGKTPRRQSYNKKTEQIRASFSKETCQNCPLREECSPEISVRVSVKKVSRKTVDRARIIELMGTEAYQKLAHIRNGVESIPSQLKNRYRINEIRQRGLFNASMQSGLKILALAITKLAEAWLDHCYPSIDLLENIA